MATPQAGIFSLGTRTHHHLEYDVAPDASTGEIVAAVQRLHEPHVTGGASNLVIGFGSTLWTRLHEHPPADLADFTEIVGLHGHTAPTTQHDIWIWIHGTGRDVVLDSAIAVTDSLAPVATLADETDCFVYHDSRDLSGFIDGTENPSPSEASDVVLIADGLAGAGGSHVIAQRWVHDLTSFGHLSVDEQQRVIGRTKPDSVALEREIRPADAHIRRAELLDADGEERPIYRRSVPFGSVGERGLYFVGFSAERDRFDGMLAQMFGTSGDGVHDRLLDFSTPVSGSYYFAPGIDDLAAIGLDQTT